MKTTGSTILITGATSGIGRGLAERFLDAGSTVILGGRRSELLDEFTAAHPGSHSVVIDVTDPESIAAAVETVTREHPDLDVVVTMAGIMLPEDLQDSGHLDTAAAIVETNLLGTIRTLTAFTPWIAAKPDGVLMTVSSGLAFVPLPATPTYSATKAAVHSYTQSLRAQLAETPVQVIELVPPAVQTTLMGQQDDPSAMPLEEFLDETVRILATQPDVEEVLVDRVRFLRDAEAEGRHADVLALLSSRH
ncbi:MULTISPECIES: SDR family oxidoreductase [unclassified Rathayibacter]|uniref:SDR family oxidoreductase n=1 Tax=unclassified Rathayibacter TaxID=2609250 RepID=UPI000F4BEE14|nr:MULTISPECIES: SDR family NAD(P)-dependent oxidoreductase [unclassified Rathayibacter]ROP57945.1 putative oxidoreductase [Rathayibacter sp. PhB186]ROS56330.1 putative oxidoreductase [Rathayibacter sp. PhB185]